MSAPKPCLGYRSRTAAVIALRSEGLTDSAISDRIGIPVASVAALGASGRRRKRPAEAQGKTVLFPIDILDRLRPHAERRGVSCNELARRLVETAIDDGMIDAVLDDGAH
jgi:predicted nucleic acid-binding protein